MSRKFISKYGIWIVTHGPLLPMLLMLGIDPTLWQTLTPYSGYSAVGFLVLVLALNPLKSAFPTFLILKKLNLYRQEFGVACFSYSMIHLLCFIVKRGSLSSVLPYMFHPALMPVFFVALPIFFVLAPTSTKHALKKMGFVQWKRLHRKVYYVEGAVFLHMVLVGEKLWALLLFIPLLCFQIFRIIRQRKLKKRG